MVNLNFELEVISILETRAYEINDEERIPVINNWLGGKGLLLMEDFTQEETNLNHKGTALNAN